MRRRRGSIFVIALAVMAGLVAILASVAATHHTFVRAEANRIERDRARLAAESGIQRALALLQTVADGTAQGSGGIVGTTGASGATLLTDEWAEFGRQGDERFLVGNASFRIQIVDLAGRVNLNTAPQEQLERLPLTNEQVEALLDYREPGQEPRAMGGKDMYYNNLSRGYNAKLRGLDTFDELLHVRGFTAPDLYEVQTDIINSATAVQGNDDEQLTLYDLVTVYSYSPELNPLGEAKINVNGGNQAQRQQRLIQVGLPQPIAEIIAAQNWPTMGQLLTALPGLTAEQQRLLLDNVTTTALPRRPGRINLNTATESVLSTVPGITPDIAQAIVQRQNQGFASLGEVLDVPGMSGQVLAQSVDWLGVASQTFAVRVVGNAGRASYALEAIVDLQNGVAKVVSIAQTPFADMPRRWNWSDEPSTETVLMEAA